MPMTGYELLEEVCRNERHVLRRGRRRFDGRPVLLKLPREQPPRPADAQLLEREWGILHDLSLPGVARAYALERNEGTSCLVLEHLGEVPLEALLASPADVELCLKVAIQIATVLAELHRRDLIHQNVNARSILVHPTTGEARLTDFSLAARAPVESLAPLPPQLLRSGLAYVSPEQTGRMNRAVDYRTDFYSLGVTLYQFLTGVLPFQSVDALELIHSHIAKTPPPPAKLRPEVPQPLSQIVMKLLAKTAEERYQSAAGLRADLETCQRQWTTNGRVEPFALGQRDNSDRFLIPQKLYGRGTEMEELLRAFDGACEGPAAMMLVAGYSGIGKTSLIQELYRPIVRQRGYFIAGKFDQIVRNVPHGALIQAFRSLLQQLLTESEDRLERWRTRLSEALGANAGVLAEVIPEIELILGKQQPPPPVAPAEAQNRFQLAFQKFVGALARREHPLVVFLDDLQWSDPATLSLLGPLLTSEHVEFLFLIGAYRENEVEPSHPLKRTLATLESAGVRLHRLVLGPLRLPDLGLLIQDTLRREPADVEPLAALVLRKTDGNPFFVLQFLKSLSQEKLLEFDDAQGCWVFRMEEIARAATTDNVIDLMTRKIQRLPAKTQRTLTLAACIGNRFDTDTLATVSEQSVDAAAEDVAQALEQGLIVAAPSASATCEFLHDRVQQAAYALIPEERKQIVHLAVGRLLRQRWDPANAGERLFDLVHHLNLGRDLITDDAERLDLARLDLAAGRKAKSSTAHDAALGYFHAENVYLQEEIQGTHNFIEMVGSSPALLAVLRKIEQVAPTDSTVLISGETGTGKELVARAVHSRSARRDRPLVKVNCSAISAGLVESELFGHVKGAFTGALERRVGRFELADGGTIFLDEVGELPLETQVKLLRVLQEQEFEPVGSSKSIRVDVRVIAATNRDLQEAVRAGRFRADLFYRLNVIPLDIPPLRERSSDVRQLATFFLSRFSQRFGKKVSAVSDETMEHLIRYPWPGNIRELQNVIERAVVVSRGAVLELDRELGPVPGGGDREGAESAAAAPPKFATLEEVERNHIVAILDQTGWVIEGPKGAARILKLHPNTLRSRMGRLGVRRNGGAAR